MTAARHPFPPLTHGFASTLSRIFLLFVGLAAAWSIRAADAPMAGLADKPLTSLSGPRGATLFTNMPGGKTGVVTENNYADPRMWGDRYQEFSVGAIGTGVAIGDYDGDGRPDIFVVSKTESCRLFRNLGDWKFEDVTDKAGVGDKGEAAAIWKQGATFVDVNNDGLLDIYVCRFNAPNLLYINQGDGTFKERPSLRTGRQGRLGMAASATTTATAGSMSTSRPTCSNNAAIRTASAIIFFTTTATAPSPT